MFETMTKVIKIEAVSQRAKNRVREHGNTFTVRATGTVGLNTHIADVLAVSMDGNWFGWFEVDKDIKIVASWLI